MKILLKILGTLVTLYLLCWVGLAAYFGYAERHKSLLESNLSSVFGRQVQIQSLTTTWIDWQPSIQIEKMSVAGDHDDQPALAFDRATMIISPTSIFTFWPRFVEFAVEQPSLEIATLANGEIQVAGMKLSNKRAGINREKLISWLLDHNSAAWHNGEIRWRKSDGRVQRYSDISFLYQRKQQQRSARATIRSPKGKVSVNLAAEGDLLSSDDWDASVDLISGTDQQLIQPGDLSFNVENGMGQIRLARLDIERIRDFMALSGLADKARWILDADLSGRLHDVKFEFTGALIKLSDWSLRAAATDIDFKSLDSLPALNNLNGELQANAKKGSFNFTAVNSTFEWAKLYDQAFPISSARGRFTWQRNADGAFEVSLHQGELTDPNLSIYDINADLVFDQASQKVSSIGELFQVDAVKNLEFDDGDVVAGTSRGRPKPLTLDASAKFDVSDMSELSAYLPKIKNLNAFRGWLQTAYRQGEMDNGRMSYRGEISPTAMREGKAKLEISADFDAVTVDYAPSFDWPPATNGSGRATLENDFLTVQPDKLTLNGDAVTDGLLTIEDLFSKKILLRLRGKTRTSLQKGMAFIFQGPLIAPAQRPEELPVTPTGGTVDIDVNVQLPLARLSGLKVEGTSTIRNGQVLLPENVPLTEINAVVAFTENTVTSDSISAQFLGGKTQAKLITTERNQPPKMQLQGSGLADVAALAPWVGEHLLTWFDGKAEWNGTLDIDGANLVVNGTSDLQGIEVTAPAPLTKSAEQATSFNMNMNLGGKRLDGLSTSPSLLVNYAEHLRADFAANPNPQSSLFDNGLVQVGKVEQRARPQGLNFIIDHPTLDIDDLLDSVIELASYEPKVKSEDTSFLDAMRSVTINTPAATSLSRPFGAFTAKVTSGNGIDWAGSIDGDNISGRIEMQPRADVGSYTLNLQKLIIGPEPDQRSPVLPIDESLQPSSYPALKLTVDTLRMDGKALGALDFSGRPGPDGWMIEKFALVHNGIRTVANGKWVNGENLESLSSFDFSTTIDEAEGVLTDMDFDGYIRKGRGSIGGTVEWPGAPHEFEYSRLNGKFDLFIKDGELVQVAPGGGKLLGLLNFNAIARRLVFDFRDLFASGLQFDRMRYRGLFSDGEAILQDAFILTPAVFVRMEGKVDLHRELVDMDVHISPELGGNLTLLSALANPTAGAVVFLTSQIFKDDMRRASFKSYQAKGTWEDFEMVEIDSEGKPIAGKETTTDKNEATETKSVDAPEQAPVSVDESDSDLSRAESQ